MKLQARRALQKHKVFVELIDFYNAGDLDWLVIALPSDHAVSMSINTYIPRDDFQVFLSPGTEGEGVQAKTFEDSLQSSRNISTMSEFGSNIPAAGKAGKVRQLTIEHRCAGLPEPRRWGKA
jgi:hypothetical protein